MPSAWKEKAARLELPRVTQTQVHGPLRFIKFRTDTGPCGSSLCEWISVDGHAYSRTLTLLHTGTEALPSIIQDLDREIFEILWGLAHPCKTVLLP